MAYIENWPPVRGEYVFGNPENQVAIITLGSELDKSRLIKKAAIIGTMKTENIGIEKVISNIISNTNIRYLVVCGAEVHGHLSGDAIISLKKNGIDEEGRIIGAKGAIPYISNLSKDIIDIWREQIEIIDLINIEDIDRIEKEIESLQPKKAFEGEPISVELGKDGEDKQETKKTVSSELVAIESRVKYIESEIKDIGKIQKIMSGIISGLFQGFVIGFIITLIILVWLK